MGSPLTRSIGRLLVTVGLTAVVVGVEPASAAEAPVGLGTAASFAVLGGETVTNTGPSVITGDVGVSPGTAIEGFPPGTVNPPSTFHAADEVAAQAQLAVTTAYNDAAGRSPSGPDGSPQLAGRTLVAGVYHSAATLRLDGTLTLDGQGDPNAVFIFQADSDLITGSASTVALINGAQACNVYWKIGSSATLGTNSTFVGTVLALTSVFATTGASVSGRLLARNAEVTLDSNTITASSCAAPTTTTTTGSTTTTTGGSGSRGGGGTTGTATPPTLANTGSHLTGVAVLGLFAVALGALLVRSSRHRQRVMAPRHRIPGR